MHRNTYVEINLTNIAHNIKTIIDKYDYKYYIGVVKGNAYGHGYGIIDTLLENGINFLAVSNLDEALEIRKKHKNIKIVCLEPISIEYLDICSKENISICVSNYDYFQKIKNLKFKINIHLKIDSGMNRLGFNNKEQIDEVYKSIQKEKNIYLEGIFTHFSTSGIYDKNYDEQLSCFKELTSDIDLKSIEVVHIDKSATMQAHEKIDFVNGVRLGIIMYGFNSVPKYGNSLRDKLRLLKWKFFRKRKKISTPVLDNGLNLKQTFSLISEVLEVKEVKANSYIGYGTGVVVPRNTKIAIVDVGYADGINKKRIHSNVEINGKLYPIIADVCMGMILVEVDENVNNGDKVTVIGGKIGIIAVSNHLNTTVYETMTMIDSNIKRIYRR